MIIFLFYLFGVAGLFLLAYVICDLLLRKAFEKVFAQSLHLAHVSLFFLSLSWVLSQGLMGTSGLWVYRLDLPIEAAIVLNGILGFLGLLLFLYFWRNHKLKFYFPSFPNDLNRWEKIILGTILFGIGIYAYCAIAPWYEWDEMVTYGREAKDYALGLIFSANFDGSFGYVYRLGSKLGEILTAQSFYIAQDVFLSRGLRFTTIVFTLISVFTFLRFLGVGRLWSLIGVATILFAMDLQKVGVTLKVDTLLWSFEISALMIFILALLSFFPQYTSLKSKRTVLMLLAVVFSVLASATRISGLYICFLITLIALWDGATAPLSFAKRVAYLLGVCGILAACGVGYLMNIYDFNNPFYPLSSPWPFQEGTFVFGLKDWQTTFNLDVFPPVLNQIYLLIHSALGVGVIGHKLGLDFLPGTDDLRNHIRWLSPALLTIFISPFFWRRCRVLKILSIIFIYWFTLWSLGSHYTRLFIAGSGVCIFLAVLIANLDRKTLAIFQRRLQRGVQFLLIFSLGIFIPLHVKEAFSYFHDWQVLFSPKARYEAKLRRLSGESGHPFVLPTFEEARFISQLFKEFRAKQFRGPVVQTEYTRALQIYFNDGHFTDWGWDNGEFEILGKADCYLGFHQPSALNIGMQEESVKQAFPEKPFDNGGFFLRCRSGFKN